LPNPASDGTKKAGSDACFFRIPERKNFRIFYNGYGDDSNVEIDLNNLKYGIKMRHNTE
jgi:hypothetical protein